MMNCNNCGAENRGDAKFCANCGAQLQKIESEKNTKACFNCGFENTRDAKFCASCGAALRRHQHPQSQQRGQRQRPPKKKERRVDTKLHWHPALVGLLIMGGVVLLLTIPYITGNPPGRDSRPEPLTEITSTDLAVEARVKDVASKFICSCGACGEQPLDSCTCNTAIQERQFIRNTLQSGQTPDQVIAAVNTTYGWMKPEFVVHYDSLARQSARPSRDSGSKDRSKKLTIPQEPQNRLLKFSQVGTEDTGVGTVFDREEIFSHFQCPCGQCGIDELKDCSCDHPRGAKEVKAFIDQKIAEKKYTVAQLIDQLDKRYGGRKF